MAPRIPKALWSAVGALPVILKNTLVSTDDAYGMFYSDSRTIAIDSSVSKATQLATFWHEATHVALWDSGVEQSLTDPQLEAVCDAMGAYLAGMMVAGCLTVRAPT